MLRAGGSYAEADQFAAAWFKQHPEDRVFAGYPAESALERQDYPGAARLYKELLQKYPNDVVALNNLASVSHQLKDPNALEYAERANELAPDNARMGRRSPPESSLTFSKSLATSMRIRRPWRSSSEDFEQPPADGS